jgi:simple sugar transport system ATP-binding protein
MRVIDLSIPPRVELRNVSKSFLGVKANDDISLTVREGEIVALLGENGAGKTTLMNVLFGLYAADSGEVLIDGTRRHFRSPAQAIAAGVGMIHQHFTLVSGLSVLKNLMVGPYGHSGFLLNSKAARAKALDIAQRYRLDLDLDAAVFDLSVGQRQKAEILKALFRGARVLIMDEPTAVLTPQESELLFATLRELVAGGMSIILISHKMKEIMAVTDRVYVLRRGKLVAERRTAESSAAELSSLMVGRDLEKPSLLPAALGPSVLSIRGLCARKRNGTPALSGLSLEARSGEILGLAGVSGNGQTELCDILFGLLYPESGEITLDGEPLPPGEPSAAINRGMARIPEDRIGTGLLMDLSVEDNLILPRHGAKRFRKGLGLINKKATASFAEELIGEFSVKTDGRRIAVRSLSGGNLQKVILARELQGSPRLIVASQPTRGLDIGAIDFVHRRLLAERARGSAVLLVSDDLDEILGISDRVAVISGGRVTGVLSRAEFDRARIGLLMSGEKA